MLNGPIFLQKIPQVLKLEIRRHFFLIFTYLLSQGNKSSSKRIKYLKRSISYINRMRYEVYGCYQ